jgi:hypothetical protein
MSAEAQGLQIPVGLSLEEAQLALKQLEQMAREAGKKVKAGLGEGEKAAGGFSDSISKWRKEEMQEGRRVGFLVDQFTAGLVPATGAAREGINLLTKSLIGGFGLGLALDAAGAGVRLLVEWYEKEEKAEAKAREAAEAHGKVLRDLAGDTEAYLRSLSGSTAALEFLYSKQREFNEKTYADRKRLDEIEVQRFMNEFRGVGSVNEGLEEREEILKRLKTAETEWNAARGSFRERQAGDEAAAARKKEQEIAAAIREARIAADNKLFEERYDLAQQHAAKLKEMRSQVERSEIQEQLDAEAAFASARAERMLKKEQEERDAAKALRDAYNAADDAEFISRYEMQLAREQAYIDIENRMFEEAYNERLAMEQRVRDLGTQGFQSFARSAVGEFGKILNSSRSYSAAMRAAGKATQDGADLSAAAFAKMGQDMLSTIAQQAAVEAIFQLARGLAFSATGNAASASAAYAAAATFGIAAGAAGAGAIAIGQTRGTTRAERASISSDASSLSMPSVGSAPSGAREVGGSGGGIGQAPTRTVEIIYGGDLFTPQELAQAHARRQQLAEELKLLRAS